MYHHDLLYHTELSWEIVVVYHHDETWRGHGSSWCIRMLHQCDIVTNRTISLWFIKMNCREDMPWGDGISWWCDIAICNDISSWVIVMLRLRRMWSWYGIVTSHDDMSWKCITMRCHDDASSWHIMLISHHVLSWLCALMVYRDANDAPWWWILLIYPGGIPCYHVVMICHHQISSC